MYRRFRGGYMEYTITSVQGSYEQVSILAYLIKGLGVRV